MKKTLFGTLLAASVAASTAFAQPAPAVFIGGLSGGGVALQLLEVDGYELDGDPVSGLLTPVSITGTVIQQGNSSTTGNVTTISSTSTRVNNASIIKETISANSTSGWRLGLYQSTPEEANPVIVAYNKSNKELLSVDGSITIDAEVIKSFRAVVTSKRTAVNSLAFLPASWNLLGFGGMTVIDARSGYWVTPSNGKYSVEQFWGAALRGTQDPI
jgi:hypothetical protein